MNTTNQEQFFFWLLIDNKLDEVFYSASSEFARLGIKLIPVKIDQVTRLAALTNMGHITVLCSTRHSLQYSLFTKHIAPVLSMLLRQDRLTLFHFSSFQKLDLGAKGLKQKNYFFLKYPLNLESLCAKLKKFHELRLDRTKAWPGGRRAKVPGLAV
ncbi:MAG: hypothetical protein K2P81_07650 [Bacteriovoracaceae bacterium]|nr:hypothetical protein [Bacteriovoracaceae bacterium]